MKGILCSMLANNEKVVEMFKSIDTRGLPKNCFIGDVNMVMEQHCNSKARTWIAELTTQTFGAHGML